MEPIGGKPGTAASLTTTGEVMEHEDGVSPERGGRVCRRLRFGTAWQFTRHLLEMVVAMMVGMAALGAAIWALGEPPGYAHPLVEYGLMGASMSAPMVAWMRYRGHSWSDGLEMAAAMLVPMLALVVPVEVGAAGYVSGLSEDSLITSSHAAMIGGMVVLMLLRRDRYAHGHRSGHIRNGARRSDA